MKMITVQHAQRMITDAGLKSEWLRDEKMLFLEVGDLGHVCNVTDDPMNGASVDANSVETFIMTHGAKDFPRVVMNSAETDPLGTALDAMVDRCHNASYAAGWWHHPETGYPYIPGDIARAKGQGGNLVEVSWAQLPPLARQMISHYFPMFLACKMMLVVSEEAEAMEGLRKGIMDDKLLHRLAVDAETIDGLIRQFDKLGALKRAARLGVVDPQKFDVQPGSTFIEKLGFNAVRPDHKVEARVSTGGKLF